MTLKLTRQLKSRDRLYKTLLENLDNVNKAKNIRLNIDSVSTAIAKEKKKHDKS